MGIFNIYEDEVEEDEDEEIEDEHLKKLLLQINDPYQGLTKVKYYENYYYKEQKDGEKKIMVEDPKYPHINDVTTPIRKITGTTGNFSVLEYDINLAIDEADPKVEYLRSMAGKHNRQLLTNLDEDHEVIIKRGAMALTAGDVESELNVDGILDYIKHWCKSKFLHEDLIYTRWYGNGQLMLEPSDNVHILLLDIEDWGEKGIVVEKEMFLAADGDVDVNFKFVGKLLTGIFGGEGYFNVGLKGRGVVALLNNAPMSQLMTIELHDEEVRIDGNFAVCWSSNLDFHVEFSRKGKIIPSLLQKEGKKAMVNVYRGTGKILVSPVANSIKSRRMNQKVKHLDEDYEYDDFED